MHAYTYVCVCMYICISVHIHVYLEIYINRQRLSCILDLCIHIPRVPFISAPNLSRELVSSCRSHKPERSPRRQGPTAQACQDLRRNLMGLGTPFRLSWHNATWGKLGGLKNIHIRTYTCNYECTCRWIANQPTYTDAHMYMAINMNVRIIDVN